MLEPSSNGNRYGGPVHFVGSRRRSFNTPARSGPPGGHLEVHLAPVILDKKSRAHVKMEDACREVLVELGLGITIPSEWVAKVDTTATPSTAAKKADVFRTYDDSERMTNAVEVIKGLGFAVGQKVERYDQVGIIHSISEGEVELRMEEPAKGNVWVNSSSFAQNEWKIAHVPKPQEEVHWLPDSPCNGGANGKAQEL